MRTVVPGFSAGSQGSASSFVTAAIGLVSKQVSSHAGRLYKLSALNVAATRYYLMFFDTTSAPSDGQTPIWIDGISAYVAGTSDGRTEVTFGPHGLYFANGIYAAVSTTAPTLTKPASGVVIISAEFS